MKFASLDEIDPILQQLHQRWDTLRRGRAFPSRADFDPVELKFALGNVSLIDVLYDPVRFRYRLVSTRITDHLGYEMTGKLVDEMPEPEMREYVRARYLIVLERRAPFAERGAETIGNRIWHHQTVYLPLSGDGQTIDMIMAGRITEPPKPAR